MSENQLHVTLVSTQAKWHGGETQAALLADGLRKRGHRCSILCRRDSEFERRMTARGFEVHAFPSRGRTPAAVWKIRSALKSLQPQIVHSNDAHALTASSLAGFGLGIPLRVAARRVDFPIRSKTRYRRFSDGLICVSNAVAEVCKAAGLASHTYVVHDGVEPAFAESGCRETGRASLGLAAEERLLLTVAKLTDHKGHTYLLRALPAIRAAHPQVEVAFAGDGELRDALQAEAEQLGVADCVRFLGYRDDVADLLAAADVIVQPSHMEGLCSSLIDAMLAARPIVACRAGGIPDLLDTGSDTGEYADQSADQGTVQAAAEANLDPSSDVGWLVPSKSPSALTTAIDEALRNPDVAAMRANNARQRALQRFTDDHMVDATLQAYARMAVKRLGAQAAGRIPGLDWESAAESLDDVVGDSDRFAA